jgi:hypothetical protein
MTSFGGDNQELSIVIKARDEATAVFKNVGTSVGKMATNFDNAKTASTAIAVGIAGAATAIGAFGVMAVKAASSAEVEMARFGATLATMGKKGTDARAGILAAAAAAVKLGFDDEEAANSIASLFQRTGDLSQAIKLNTLAMDLARAKGIQLSESQKLISLVMSGNQRALKLYGIEISDTLTPMQALDELQTKVAGQAQGFSQTFQGQMAAFHVTFQNLLETVGTKLLPLLTQFIAAMLPVIEKVIEWSENTANLVGWLQQHQAVLYIVAGAIAGALTPALIGLAVTIFTTVIPAFFALAVALAPYIIGGAIIGGMVAGILWVVNNWALVKEKLGAIWEGIKGVFAAGVNFLIGIAEAWANSWVKAVNVILGALNKIHFSIPDWAPGVGGKSFGINIPLAAEVKLPRFEHGGIVPGAIGTAVPILAHGGERIVPAGRSAGGQTTYSVVINNPTVRNREDANYLRRQIEEALRDVSRGHKLATV